MWKDFNKNLVPAIESKSTSANLVKFNTLRYSDMKRSATVSDDSMETETGPVLSAKKRAAVDSFVSKMGGKRTIQRILIANNGMAATKAIMSMRQWAYMVLGKFLLFILMKCVEFTTSI